MRVAVIGTGILGGALAHSLAWGGHAIVLGSRNVEDTGANKLAKAIGATVAAPVDAARAADAVALAIPAGAVVQVAKALARELVAKGLIFPANEFGKAGASRVPDVLAAAQGAHVIRGFNTLAAETLARAHDIKPPMDMFFAADEGAPTDIAEVLIKGAGLTPVRLGDIKSASLVDSVFQIWAALAFEEKRGRGISLSVRAN